MKNCPYCNTVLNDDAAFCTGCGKNVAAVQLAVPIQPAAPIQPTAPAQPDIHAPAVDSVQTGADAALIGEAAAQGECAVDNATDSAAGNFAENAPAPDDFTPPTGAASAAVAQAEAFPQPTVPPQPEAYAPNAASAGPTAPMWAQPVPQCPPYQQPAAPYGAPQAAKKRGIRWWHILLIVLAPLTAAAVGLVTIFGIYMFRCDDRRFVGKWETTYDIGEYINDVFSEQTNKLESGLDEYFEVEEFEIKVWVEFNDDGTYKVWYDKKVFKNSLNSYVRTVKEGMKQYFKDYLEEYEVDMSVDELFRESGLDLDLLINEMLNKDNLIKSLENKTEEGNFSSKDGKLYMSGSLRSEISEKDYETYEFNSSDEFVLTKASEDSVFELGDDVDLFPLTFSRAG